MKRPRTQSVFDLFFSLVEEEMTEGVDLRLIASTRRRTALSSSAGVISFFALTRPGQARRIYRIRTAIL